MSYARASSRRDLPGVAESARPVRLACFVSSHGFGHATRTCAVLEALERDSGAVDASVWTGAPARLFESLGNGVSHHPLMVDAGPVQADAFRVDIAETARRLEATLPFDERAVDDLADKVSGAGCGAIVCDISPIGLVVAERAGLPSVLIENFTWDFIYRGLGDRRLERWAHYLESVFARARWRIRAEPACGEADADLVVPPVSRRPVHDRAAVRALLGVGEDDIVVLVSFGGVSGPGGLLKALGRAWPEIRFVVVGPSAALEEDAYALPATLAADHPGLVGGVDAVIGKLGYGTVAEVYAAGVPFLGFAREGFPESAWLERFVSRHMRAQLVPAPQHGDTDWVAGVGDVLALGPPSPARGSNGADAISRFLREVLPRRNQLGRDRP